MQNWHRYAVTVLVGFVCGVGGRFIQPHPDLLGCLQSGVSGVLPSLLALQLTLTKSQWYSGSGLAVPNG